MILRRPNRLLGGGGVSGWPLAGTQLRVPKRRADSRTTAWCWACSVAESTPSRFAEWASNKRDKLYIHLSCLQTRRRIQSGVYRGSGKNHTGANKAEENVCRSCQSCGSAADDTAQASMFAAVISHAEKLTEQARTAHGQHCGEPMPALTRF